MANKTMYYSLKCGAFCARVVPRSWGHRVLGSLGYAYGSAPTKLQKNLMSIHRKISPWMTISQARERSAHIMRSYARYWWDVFWLSSPRSRSDIENIVTIEGMDVFDLVLDKINSGNHGVIFALPHIGSWEIAGAWVAQQGHRPVVVVERLQPPELYELFRSTREGMGMIVIPHDDHPTGKLLAALKNSEVISLVSDRDISRKGIALEFFGDKKTFPVGAAVLALKTGAPIVPVCTYINHDCSVTISFGTPIFAPVADSDIKDQQVEDITKELVDQFERMILRDPTQWHVLQNEWEKA